MLSYSHLREIQKKEKDSAAIVPLEEEFYSSAAEFLEEKRKAAMESGSLLSIKEYENLRKIMSSIQMRREEKIVLMAIRNENEGKGLARQEKELLSELSKSIMQCREKVNSVWNPPKEGKGGKKVRILKDIEPYTGLDKKTYGPFKSGDELLLPNEEAQWLLKSGMAESM